MAKQKFAREYTVFIPRRVKPKNPDYLTTIPTDEQLYDFTLQELVSNVVGLEKFVYVKKNLDRIYSTMGPTRKTSPELESSYKTAKVSLKMLYREIDRRS